jgi:hypothetical protein
MGDTQGDGEERGCTQIRFPAYRVLYKGCPTMKSKLLQKKSYSLDRPDAVLDDQQENIEDSSEPLEAARNRPTRPCWLLTSKPAS